LCSLKKPQKPPLVLGAFTEELEADFPQVVTAMHVARDWYPGTGEHEGRPLNQETAGHITAGSYGALPIAVTLAVLWTQ
jgi:hypothetical protein